MIDPGFDIKVDHDEMTFKYGKDVFGPQVEFRYLNDIRNSLLNPSTEGPDIVYAIAMDVGDTKDLNDLKQRSLLYGAVTYASGRLDTEPVRSQGHIHSISASCNYSTAEVYEVWAGRCIVLLQESAEDNPGRVFAIHANPGEIVIVPPGWAHATINADVNTQLTFGAWCIRDYGFEYARVRAHHGLAYYPQVDDEGNLSWERNPTYKRAKLIEKAPESYANLGIDHSYPIYSQYQRKHDAFNFVTKPTDFMDIWDHYTP